MNKRQPRIGIVLSGGGARGAYQAGALRAIAEITKEAGIDQPFQVISGMSAGAINAAHLACAAPDMVKATVELEEVWSSLSTDQVFRVSLWSTLSTGIRWIAELISGGWIPSKERLALLDTSPLRRLLSKRISWDRLSGNIEEGVVHSLTITAVNYADGSSCSFYQSHYPYEPFLRVRRHAEPAKIEVDHVMASTAIPFLFPPYQIGKWYFGDGSLRNHTPLSPAIKGGAERLLVIGVRRKGTEEEEEVARPSQGRIFSVLLNSLFLDAIDLDLERLQRINETLKYVPATAPTELRPIPVHSISPSEDVGQIALEEADAMPRLTRWLIRGLGSREETAGLISYLLFERRYTQRLSQLGYRDAMAQRDEILQLYS